MIHIKIFYLFFIFEFHLFMKRQEKEYSSFLNVFFKLT